MSTWKERRDELAVRPKEGGVGTTRYYSEEFQNGFDAGRADAETEFIAASRLAKLDTALIAQVKAETELAELRAKLEIAVEALEFINKAKIKMNYGPNDWGGEDVITDADADDLKQFASYALTKIRGS